MLFGASFSAKLHQPSADSAANHPLFPADSPEKKLRFIAGAAGSKKR
jgi:hypothetical protein